MEYSLLVDISLGLIILGITATVDVNALDRYDPVLIRCCLALSGPMVSIVTLLMMLPHLLQLRNLLGYVIWHLRQVLDKVLLIVSCRRGLHRYIGNFICPMCP